MFGKIAGIKILSDGETNARIFVINYAFFMKKKLPLKTVRCCKTYEIKLQNFAKSYRFLYFFLTN